MDRRYCDFVCGMAEGGGICVRRDWGERGAWLGIGRHLGEEWGPMGLGCSIHPSARLSRYVPGKLGSWDRVFGWVIVIGGVEIAYMKMIGLLG